KLEGTARSGASGLELAIDAGQHWTRRLSKGARTQLRRQASDLGLAFSSLCINAHWVFNMTSPDVRIRDLGISLLVESVELAHDLDAGVILVPGCDQEESPASRWALFRSALMQAITPAEQAGVVLGLEAVGRPFLSNSRKLRRMIEACGGSQALGIYLDVGNATAGLMDPAAEIRTAGNRAAMVHVKDWDPADRGKAFLGAGAVDWARCLPALKEVSFDGYLTVELAADRSDPEKVARESVRFLQSMLGH
ncbi:MAG: sugar phosphate isomerase/epimerase family protein, partial [Chloroflexota bacterium]